MVDHRITKPVSTVGGVDPRVVQALRQAIAEASEESTRTATYLFWRTEQILTETHGAGAVPLPSQSSLYWLLKKLAAGRHTTGSASTRRSPANRPDGPFSPLGAAAPGELMEIDSTLLDVLVQLDDGVVAGVELTGLGDIATRHHPGGGAAPDHEGGGRFGATGPHAHANRAGRALGLLGHRLPDRLHGTLVDPAGGGALPREPAVNQSPQAVGLVVALAAAASCATAPRGPTAAQRPWQPPAVAAWWQPGRTQA